MTTPMRSALALLGVVAMGLVSGTGCSQDIDDIRTAGIEQYRSRQYVESTATFRHALTLQPSDAQSNYYMGLNYRAMAERKFRQGDIPAAQRELDTAVVYFTQAVKSWPNYMAAVEAKTEALEARGQYMRSLDVADTVADNNRGGPADFYVFAGDKYRDMGDYDSALRNYRMALSTDPNCAKAYASMGKLYALTGDRAKALDAYARATQLNPHDTEAADQLAHLGGASSGTDGGAGDPQP